MKRALSLVLAVVMVFSLALGVVAADTARAALADSGTDSGPVDSGAVIITFDLNYDGAPAAQTAEADADGKVTCPFTEDELVRAGYTFDGWYETAAPSASDTKVDLETQTFSADDTLYANWNEIKVPAGMDSEDVSIEGAPEGATLTITDQGLTNTEESVKAEIEKLPNVEIAPESPVVIYDISLDVTGGNVTITLPVPQELDASKTIMALHFAKDRTEVLTVKIVDGKMQFTVDSFSEFAFFNADEAAAADSYKVKIEESEHGVLDVQAVKDNVGGKYLPVGETTTVPAEDVTGSSVTRGGGGLFSGLDIRAVAASGYVVDTITATAADGTETTVQTGYYELTGDVTLSATFVKRGTSGTRAQYSVEANPSDYPTKSGDYAPGEISSALEFWYYDPNTREERQLTPATFELDPDSPSYVSNEYFEVKDGKLVNKVELPGTEEGYGVQLKVTYAERPGSAEYRPETAQMSAHTSISTLSIRTRLR